MVWKKSFFVLACCFGFTFLSSSAFAARLNPVKTDSAKVDTSKVYNRFAEIIQKETGEEPIAVMARSSTLFIDIRKTLGSNAANNTLSIIQGIDQNLVKDIANAKNIVQDVLYVVYNGQPEEVQDFTGYLIAHDSTIMSEVYKTYGVDMSEDSFKLAGLVAMSPAMKRAIEKEVNDKTTPAPGGGSSGDNGAVPRGESNAVSGGGESGGGDGDAGTTFGNCLLNVALSKQKNGGPIMLFGDKGPGGGVGDPMTMPSDEGTNLSSLWHFNTGGKKAHSIKDVPCGMIDISKTGGAVGKSGYGPSDEIDKVWHTAYDVSYHLTRAENMLEKAEKLAKSGDSIDHAVAEYFKEKAKDELKEFSDAAQENEQAVNDAIHAGESAEDIHAAEDSGKKYGKDAANDAGQANGNPDQPPDTETTATPRWDDDSNSGSGDGNCGEAWEQCVGGNEGGGGSDDGCEGKFSNTLLGKKDDNSPKLPSDDATSAGICGENGGGGIDAKFLFNSTGLGTYDPSPLDGPGVEPTGEGDPTPAPYSSNSPIKEMKQLFE